MENRDSLLFPEQLADGNPKYQACDYYYCTRNTRKSALQINKLTDNRRTTDLTANPTANPNPAGPCNDKAGFLQDGVGTTCLDLKNGPKVNTKCKNKIVADACPYVCNIRCSYKNKAGKIRVSVGALKKQKFKYKILGKNNQPTCDTKVSRKKKFSDFCPKKCNTCY